MTDSNLSETGNDRIREGGNLSPFDAIVLEIDDLYAEAKNWADGEPVENQKQCDELDRLDKALLAADKQREAIRVAEKRPLDEQVKAIQARHNPIKDKVACARSALNQPRAAWKTKVAAEKEAAALKARLEAEEERRLAEEAIRSSAGDLAARERAEEQLSNAKEADSFASRQEKKAATGLGLRTTYVPHLTDLNAAIKHYWTVRRDDFEALVIDLAKADVRGGKRTIPGFEIETEKKAL